ncbi:MAG: hypothetical protein V4547_07870 [Bacteroidota bacterium]
MKKLLLCVAVISAFSFASCKKDRTCTCTSTHTDGTPASTSVFTAIDAKKSDAKKRCIDRTEVNGTDTETTTCELK